MENQPKLHYGTPVSKSIALKYNTLDNGKVRIPFDEPEVRADAQASSTPEHQSDEIDSLVPSVDEILQKIDGGKLKHNESKARSASTPKPRPDENTKYASPAIEKQVRELSAQMEQEVPDIDSSLPTASDIEALMDTMSQNNPAARKKFLQMQSNIRELTEEEMDKMIAGSSKRIR